MDDLTTAQYLARMGIFCGASLLLTFLLWLGTRYAKGRGWIVKRQEPIKEWVAFGEAQRRLGREVAKALGIYRVLDWLTRRSRP